MEAFRAAWRSVRADGICVTAQLCLSRFADLAFDWRHGTDTHRWVAPADFGLGAEQVAGAEYYKPSHAASLRKLLARLDLPVETVLLDIGCGKGRVLMVAAELGFEQARGIEFSSRLAAIAGRNLERFARVRATNTRFEVILMDVRNYRLRDDETVIYLFNPFDRVATATVLAIVEASLQRRPRRLHLIYRAPDHRELFDASPSFRAATAFDLDGQRFLVYPAAVECGAANPL